MDSLLANYGSSDEEDQQEETQKLTPPKTASSSTLFSSLPQPKSSSSSSPFQSLPQPKQHSSTAWPNSIETVSLAIPKSQIDEPQTKRVVQFKPPIIPSPNPNELDDDDDDDEEQEERNRRRKLESSTQIPSVKSFLSSLSAPKYTATLGVKASSGSGRRSIIETEAPAPSSNSSGSSDVPVDQSPGDYENYQYGTDQYAGYYGNYGSGIEPEAGVADYGSNGDAYASYGGYGDYGHNWGDELAATAPEVSGVSDSVMRFTGKRGRHEIPTEVIEVKQDELIKNRPREDQVKLTGIAFGPSYQPVSAKGKPSKLHKRKHQIGSLYFDMKQNETKLAERRAKGMLTKAETQAKYGW